MSRGAPILLCIAACAVGRAPRVEPAPGPAPRMGVLAEAARETPGNAEVAAKAACSGGLVRNASGGCTACTTDSECGGPCTVDTGRCASAGQCTSEADCVGGQACDGGFCVHFGDRAGACDIGEVYFGWDSAELPPSARARLLSAADCIVKLGRTILIEAHADNVGSEEFNILLSERRGRAVRALLVEAGVPADRLQVLAKGALEAVGTDEASRAQDRRVVLIIM